MLKNPREFFSTPQASFPAASAVHCNEISAPDLIDHTAHIFFGTVAHSVGAPYHRCASHIAGKDTATLSLVRVLIIGLYRSAVAMGRLPADIGNEKSSPSAGSYQVIWEAVVNIKENLSEDISAASHFSRLFGAVTGMTIPQYIRLLRLRMVCELTESQSLGILDAVYASGFGSTSAYYKALHELVLN